jgi:hypothetical protein
MFLEFYADNLDGVNAARQFTNKVLDLHIKVKNCCVLLFTNTLTFLHFQQVFYQPSYFNWSLFLLISICYFILTLFDMLV